MGKMEVEHAVAAVGNDANIHVHAKTYIIIAVSLLST
jgi:hypothetical protein